MNELQVFQKDNFKVRVIEKDGEPWFVAKDVIHLPKNGRTGWHGYVYAIEYGNSIKIGRATNLQQRIKAIISNAENYSKVNVGRIVFSIPHTNHKENELLLHKAFQEKRQGRSELFNLTLDEFIGQIPMLEFKDESTQKQKEADTFFENMKAFILGGKP